MKYCLLASGSRGNAIWAEEGEVAVAIDNGLSAREFQLRAQKRGLRPQKLAAIIISHEHRDHTGGIGPLARALKIPVMANPATMNAARPYLGEVREKIFATGEALDFGPLAVQTLPVSHDAADPLAFVLEGAKGALGLATDLGAVTNLVRQHFAGLRSLILEFNHDYDRLMDGPYPWPLKQRVRSRSGHLANEDAAELAAQLYHGDLKRLVLAHLSQTNNSPELALKAARSAMPEGFPITAAGQDEPTAVFEF